MPRPFGPPRSDIPSPQFSSIRGAVLTDARIAHYARLGFYGESRKQSQLLLDASRKGQRRVAANPLQKALEVLESLV